MAGSLFDNINSPIPISTFGGYNSYQGTSFKTYKVGTDSTIFAGLMVGRQGTDYSSVDSLDELTTPDVNDMVGFNAATRVNEVADGVDLSVPQALFVGLTEGNPTTIINHHMGTFYAIYGDSSDMTTNEDLYVVIGNDDVSSNVYPGMLVKSTYGGSAAILDVSSIVRLNLETTTISIAQFDVLPVSLDILSR